MSKPNSNGGQKADFAVKLVLMFFISLLSFSVGTYLGKQVSDAENKRAAIEADYGSPEHAEHAEPETAAHDAGTEPIKDEEVASLQEEYLRASRTTDRDPDSVDHAEAAHADAHHAAAPAHEPTTPIEKATDKAAERVSHGMAPTADPKKVRTPSASLPTVATTAVGKFTVQVASYVTSAEAETMATKLQNKGFAAFVVTAEVTGKTWYRVSVGRFPDQDAAKNYRTELLATQAVTSAIVQKIIK